MKQILFFILSLYLINEIQAAEQKSVDVPYITAMVEQRDGAQIRLRFKALAWDDVSMAAIQELEDQRKFFNENIFPKMGVLTTNVQLQVGSNSINPGSYYVGFFYQKGTQTDPAKPQDKWYLVVSDREKKLFNVPIPMNHAQSLVPYLSFVFTPGITDRDFILSYLYGNWTAEIKWMIKGVPSFKTQGAGAIKESSMLNETSPEAAVTGPPADAEPSESASEKVFSSTDGGNIRDRFSSQLIRNATGIPQDNRKKPGIGAFRRLFKSGEELRGRLDQ